MMLRAYDGGRRVIQCRNTRKSPGEFPMKVLVRRVGLVFAGDDLLINAGVNRSRWTMQLGARYRF
jgi:hypothetical protein